MILSDGKNDILLSTEYGLSSFYPQTKIFHNWTKEQGLQSDHFNANSGTLRKNFLKKWYCRANINHA